MELPVKPTNKHIERLAKAGLIAKGCIYVLLGALAIMAALHIGHQSSASTDKSALLAMLGESGLGKVLLLVLAVGLLCYSTWRCVQAVRMLQAGKKHYQKAARYFFSAAVYLFVCFSAIKLVLNKPVKKGDQQQDMASQLLSQPFGQWLVAAAALAIAGVGIYQMYYGWSEKYRKHTQKMNTQTGTATILLTTGKIGYLSRGIVWLVIAYLMLMAAFTGQSSRAGDTGKAFAFIETMPLGSLLLAIIAAGLVAYGVFSFVRARYEKLVD
jgi:heme/copper-type cytochrome/quinol oxidase subunit 2